ncbi:methionyl aminopeptidase [Sediminihabitans luteus]|uniref:Methionine aminopeptidase n=1 Tax=Sediminihabitans luteus TaxID=1138585 RepID=A0A2M9CZI5_9CELL|nr:M24 family metallopeptidase [Sediminihabitans luteus]PJJ77245.1 methionyl aminopeptidase [Sediminihabitans luteus]GII98694.1 methionine aminopeptidase [Sediminihabitans luteus]
MFGRERIEYKTLEQVRVMRRAGLVVADALDAVRTAARPGMTTADLDALAAGVITAAGASPSFLGYHGFTGVICASVNEEVVHGIPGSRVLAVGDLVSIDCGAIVDGWHGDSALSFVLGEDGALDPAVPERAVGARSADDVVADLALVTATERSMWDGIAALATAARLGEVGDAIDDSITAAGDENGTAYGIVTEYTGHGIGTAMHQPPDVLNFRSGHRGPRVRPGLCVAIEPMITRGSAETAVLADDWTVVTTDGSRAAHWEHSVAVTERGVVVTTARDGGAAELAARGVTIASLD